MALYKPIAYRNTSGARPASQHRMFGWLRPGALTHSKPKFGTRVVGYHPPKALKPISIRNTSGAPRRRTRNPNSFGAPVKRGGYGSNFHRGTSQSQGAVKKNGLVWGGRVFHSRSEFSRSLSAHGTNIATFAKRHKNAYGGLSTSFSRTKNSR
jgi:hypothetical protein